ncbi:S-adenosyl-L-methionine-dependent methyltransferase [Fusarium albosuccineum]|uniref:S-adenosyl-L-methionine-dependent methyltransferase n=1 Tax=Fusarium albosuccineum TaxID=1237068 RepID=A0A8H4KDF2_9HYPO|nr:S-adenosyl-L-methionine-dependent methyltransferase [Fusarium albosuccineum]
MASDTTPSRIMELATTIMASVAQLQTILSSDDIAPLSFDADAPTSLPQESNDISDIILDATSELYDLLLDPLTLIHEKGAHSNMVCLKAISHFNIAAIVPVDGQVSFEEISDRTGIELQIVRRLLRHAATMRIFREPAPGQIAHTKASKALTGPHMNDFLKVGSGEIWPATFHMLDAVQKWPNSQEQDETGYALSNPDGRSLYEVLGSDPERAMRFSNTMKAFTSRPGYDVSYVLDNYDWGSLGQALVVDVGGAGGHVAIKLAERFHNLNVIVQDNKKAIAGAGDKVPESLKQRVRFEPHDFLSPQTTTADVYYLRWVLHNWSDKYCVMILRALIPALRPGTRIVIQDTCMPEPGTIPLWRERQLRVADLNMGALFNARERSAKEWETLLKEASPKFVLGDIIFPKGSALAIFDVWWDTQGEVPRSQWLA